MKKSLARFLAPIIDVVLAPLMVLVAILARLHLRLGARAPMSRRALDKAGIGVMRHHYYQPMTLVSDLRRPLDEERKIPGLDLNESGQLALIDHFHYREELETFPDAPVADEYYYRNEAFEAGDAEMLYNIIRHFKPRRFLEVGCGFSTLMTQAALAKNKSDDPTYDCEHILIEPFEQPWLERLGVEVIRTKVEEVNPTLFSALARNDVVFIDSSHVIRPQGDVLFEYLEVLGTLAPGVLIHVHDIFTPRDYPHDWIINRRYMWNEQYLLEAFLAFNRDFEVLAANNWLKHNHAEKLTQATPVMLREPDREPGSFWFQRK